MITAPGITVNGIKITPDDINAEVQYHPAPHLQGAKYQAMQALVIRELLIQRAVKLGLCPMDVDRIKADDIIDALTDQEIAVPEPEMEECRRYYDNNRKRFYTAPLFEAAHILYLAPPEDEEESAKAKQSAEVALEKLRQDPELFVSLAENESACSSAKTGGHLGQITRGQTLPAFEAALSTMKEGEISPEPVLSDVGYHIIRLYRRIDGVALPFDTVAEWISGHLQGESWHRAFKQYIRILAGEAEISGFRLQGSDSPLVQ